MRVTRSVGAGLAAVVMVVGLAGCGGGSSKSLNFGASGSSGALIAKDTPRPHYEPNQIKVNAGQEVTFTFKNEGKVRHNFSVSFIGVDQDVDPGQSVQVKLLAKDPGTLTFYDKQYQGDGMQGHIKVT